MIIFLFFFFFKNRISHNLPTVNIKQKHRMGLGNYLHMCFKNICLLLFYTIASKPYKHNNTYIILLRNILLISIPNEYNI